MKTLKIYKTKCIILSVMFFVSFIGCQGKKSDKIDKKIAKEIVEYIINEDTSTLERYSGDIYLHITSQKINDNNFKTFVSLNGIKSTKFLTEEINIKGLKTIIYYTSKNTNFNLAEPFFVPDAKSWSFLTELKNEEIILNIIKRVSTNMNSEINDSEFDL